MKRDRAQRFGKLVSKPDETTEGRYIPWASTQSPGSVKQVVFHDDSRRYTFKMILLLKVVVFEFWRCAENISPDFEREKLSAGQLQRIT